MLQFTYI